MIRIKLFALCTLLAIAIAGCGGGGVGNGGGGTQKFTTSVAGVIAQTSDDTEPVDTATIAADSDDDAEPDPVN